MAGCLPPGFGCAFGAEFCSKVHITRNIPPECRVEIQLLTSAKHKSFSYDQNGPKAAEIFAHENTGYKAMTCRKQVVCSQKLASDCRLSQPHKFNMEQGDIKYSDKEDHEWKKDLDNFDTETQQEPSTYEQKTPSLFDHTETIHSKVNSVVGDTQLIQINSQNTDLHHSLTLFEDWHSQCNENQTQSHHLDSQFIHVEQRCGVCLYPV